VSVVPSVVVPAARPVVEVARDEVANALGGELVGLYLMGSAISGGFTEGVSDLDLVAVTASPADRLDLAALERGHGAIVARFREWRDRIEIVAIGRSTLARFRSTTDRLAVISPGERLHLSGPASDWRQNWYLARTTSVALVGPPPADSFPAIATSEFVDGIRWYAGWLGSSVDRVQDARGLSYAVLSACRAARTVATGAPCSKQDGADWMKARTPELAGLIDEALAARESRGAVGLADEPTREAARALARAVAEAIGPEAAKRGEDRGRPTGRG
jgi:predicted nucleotidyltransferase